MPEHYFKNYGNDQGEEDSETFTRLLVLRSSPAVWQELLGITGKQTEHWQPHVEN